ncbi:MAG TPA: CDP-alcohol phosphatidyltransferase family protein [Acidobacteriota bacterium]
MTEVLTPKRRPVDKAELRRTFAQQLLTLPNLFTLSRPLFLPLVALCLMDPSRSASYAALALLGCAFLTDYFDGYFARRLGQTTALGLMLDPIADKIVTSTLAVLLCVYRDYPWYMSALVIGRDLTVFLVSLFAVHAKGELLAPDSLGRKNLVVILLGMLAYLMQWQPWGRILVGLSLVTIVLSSANYLRVFLQLVGRPRA